MSMIRQDPTTKEWIIVAIERAIAHETARGSSHLRGPWVPRC